MALRKIPLVTGEIYHLFNRGVDYCPIFSGKRDYRRFLQAINFYRFPSPSVRLSQFLEFSKEKKEEFLQKLGQSHRQLVEIFCFCLMPNHFHFLLKQSLSDGISNFMRLLQNSYAKYFNLRYKRIGSLFQGEFRSVRIETDEQLTHLSRYIHLNPYSSFTVKTLKDLEVYPWSSFPAYLDEGYNQKGFLKKSFVLYFFKTPQDYKKFVFDRSDYQRKLEKIKHLVWNND